MATEASDSLLFTPGHLSKAWRQGYSRARVSPIAAFVLISRSSKCWGHEAATFQFPDKTLRGTDSWREKRVGGGWPTSPPPPSLLQEKAPASPALCTTKEQPTRSRQKKRGTGFPSSPLVMASGKPEMGQLPDVSNCSKLTGHWQNFLPLPSPLSLSPSLCSVSIQQERCQLEGQPVL